jgi:cell division protein FtsI/penicillin-binding protein 2
MINSRALKAGGMFLVVSGFSFAIIYKMMHPVHPLDPLHAKTFPVDKQQVAEALGPFFSEYQFPSEISLDLTSGNKVRAFVQYSFDLKLQKVMEGLFQAYNPDYGAFVALDASTGKILALVSYSRSKSVAYNLALRASFPSASVFKVVTATAAIDAHKISADTVIPVNGRNHTLYKGQILKGEVTRWTRFMTLKEAFASSVNTVFGKIGAFTVGSQGMRQFADRFGFNRKIAADVPIEEGHAWIPEDTWGLAESSSGFTKDNTMSPLQGALIAASIANDGVMMEPFMVEAVLDAQRSVLYAAEPKIASVTMGPETAHEVRALMKETVLHGTSRGSFRGFFKDHLSLVNVGGKTGSLTGYDPRGKYDWFVGYAVDGPHRFAVAALTIHEKLWRVKSSFLARLAIESYFKGSVHHPSIATVTKPRAHSLATLAKQ